MRTLHLFAGAGGGLLADLILGHTPVAAVEWDAYCCEVLRERAADGWFPGLIVHEGDVRDFDPAQYAGRVDAIHAGFPCQDISVAGKGAGIAEGTRSGLWSEVVRCARVIRPEYLFLENVAAITANGLGRVLADLAALGFDARWDCVRASDVGANHHRDRWWCVAYANSSNSAQRGECAPVASSSVGRRDFGGRGDRDAERQESVFSARQSASHMAYANGDGSCSAKANETEQGSDWQDDGLLVGNGDDVADADRAQLERGRASIGTRTEHADAGCTGWWEVEPDVGRVVDGLAFRVDRLKSIGNGQVPLQAAYAFSRLMP